jgi:hypothetical protein
MWLARQRDSTEASVRFMSKVVKDGDCWRWTAHINSWGYGRFSHEGRLWLAHRWAFVFVAEREIPDGLCLDHLCRNRWCVNPDHLEPVTFQENVRRGRSGQHQIEVAKTITHCPAGHEYTPENTYVYTQGHRSSRRCRACGRERWHARKAKEKQS